MLHASGNRASQTLDIKLPVSSRGFAGSLFQHTFHTTPFRFPTQHNVTKRRSTGCCHEPTVAPRQVVLLWPQRRPATCTRNAASILLGGILCRGPDEVRPCSAIHRAVEEGNLLRQEPTVRTLDDVVREYYSEHTAGQSQFLGR